MKKNFSIIFIFTILAGCQNRAVPQSPPPVSPTPVIQPNPVVPTPQAPTSFSNIFDFDTLKVGDQVAEMKVDKMEPAGDYTSMNENNIRISFSGEVKIKGKYRNYAVGEGILADIVCMDNFDAASQKKLPKMNTDVRFQWFCFRNNAFAQQQFSPPGSNGLVEVLIKNYEYLSFPSEGWDSAELVQVISLYEQSLLK